MRNIRTLTLVASIAALALAGTRTMATPIGLINTGADSIGSPLAEGSVQPGWSITAVDPSNPPGGLTPPILPSSVFVVPAFRVAWIPNNDVSKWISYSTPLYTGGDVYREFTYSLTFQAARNDNFFMRMAGDNGTMAYLNQTTPAAQLLDWGSKDGNNFSGFGSWSPWFDVSGLMEGDNTLTFVVYNLTSSIDNPTGLRVEFSTAQPGIPAVPDAPFGILIVLPLILLAFHWVRSRRNASPAG